MRGIKVLMLSGAIVALVVWLAVPATAQVQATLRCPPGFSAGLLPFALEDNNGVLWGVVATAVPPFVHCNNNPGSPNHNPNRILDVRKTGQAQKAERVDKAGIQYYCAKGDFPDTQQGGVSLMAAGGIQGKPKWVNGPIPIPAKIKLPCSPEDLELEITVGPVPTLTEWGLIALGLLLAGSLAWMIRRRVIARPAGA